MTVEANFEEKLLRQKQNATREIVEEKWFQHLYVVRTRTKQRLKELTIGKPEKIGLFFDKNNHPCCWLTYHRPLGNDDNIWYFVEECCQLSGHRCIHGRNAMQFQVTVNYHMEHYQLKEAEDSEYSGRPYMTVCRFEVRTSGSQPLKGKEVLEENSDNFQIYEDKLKDNSNSEFVDPRDSLTQLTQQILRVRGGTGFWWCVSGGCYAIYTNEHILSKRSDAKGLPLCCQATERQTEVSLSPQQLCLRVAGLDFSFAFIGSATVSALNLSESQVFDIFENIVQPRKDDDLYCIGHPLGGPMKTTTGKITCVFHEEDATFSHNCSTRPGSSGSLIVALRGNACGQQEVKIVGVHFRQGLGIALYNVYEDVNSAYLSRVNRIGLEFENNLRQEKKKEYHEPKDLTKDQVEMFHSVKNLKFDDIPSGDHCALVTPLGVSPLCPVEEYLKGIDMDEYLRTLAALYQYWENQNCDAQVGIISVEGEVKLALKWSDKNAAYSTTENTPNLPLCLQQELNAM